MKNIIILGAGFAGVRAALTFKNKINRYDLSVTVIDKNNYHTFTPALYEVATAEESPRNAIIPLKSIFGRLFEFVQGNVEKIEVEQQKVFVSGNRVYLYDYLIFALGSSSADFGIQGIKEYAVPLKTLKDAVRIKNGLKSAKRVIIGGGGFSGTELACELAAHNRHLEITLIQGSFVLLKELENGVSQLAKKRLEKEGIRLILGERIKKVTQNLIETAKGTFLYDLFIWTGGVKSNNLLGDIKVDNSLRVKNYKNIFAAGDAVAPCVAPKAEKMGKIAAKNVLRSIKKEPLLTFSYREMGYVIPLGSHFAAFAMGRYHVSGIFAYILQQLILFWYLLTIVPPIEALKRFIRFEKDLNKNERMITEINL